MAGEVVAERRAVTDGASESNSGLTTMTHHLSPYIWWPPTPARRSQTEIFLPFLGADQPPVPDMEPILRLTGSNSSVKGLGWIFAGNPMYWNWLHEYIFMYPRTDEQASGTVIGGEFYPASDGVYLVAARFTGQKTHMRLYGPWGTAISYSDQTIQVVTGQAGWTTPPPPEDPNDPVADSIHFMLDCVSSINQYAVLLDVLIYKTA